MYEIDRKVAARLLKVSVRTIDRYIVANKLSVDRRDGRIWLNKKEIVALKRQKRLDSRGGEMSMDESGGQGAGSEAAGVDVMTTPRAEKYTEPPQKTENDIYKKLFEELQQELKIKQERLEGANYRVGQLEAMVKETVPILDHQRLLGEEKAQKLKLEEGIEIVQEKLQRVRTKLKEETLSRKVYLIALFVLLILQPLWLLLSK